MKHLASPASIAAACGLIVVTDLALLAAAGWNRRGEPEAELALTERELAMPAARQDEGSAIELSLRMTHEPPGVVDRTARWKHYELPRVDYDWLDRAKLRELGVRVDLDAADPHAVEHYSRTVARPVWVVLEQDGPAWRAWIAGREEEVGRLSEPKALADAEAVLAFDRTMRSRLFPVDAGTDPELLRRRYPDRHRHAVIAALLRATVVRPEDAEPFLSGHLMGAIVRQVHVPRDLGRQLEAFLPTETWDEIETRERMEAQSGWPAATPPRYDATLALGRRHEPWLVSVARTEG